MNLTIVIACVNLWNRFTKPCLDSIRTSRPYRVVLVDNGSTDETREKASKLVSPTFVHRRYEKNIGAAGAWNWGIADGFEKGARYVLVLNNDILLHPHCIDRLIDRIECGDIALATALDLRDELATADDVFRVPSEAKIAVPESEHPNFSAFLVSRHCWEMVGPFDEKFYPAYFEDNDYHYRILMAGLRAINYPPAMFYHYGSRTQNEACAAPLVPSSLFDENRRRYVEKWGGPPGYERFRHPFGDTKVPVLR